MFPKNFIWGVASSAYQIEGAYQEDSKALSIWDVFANNPLKIANNENGNMACDSYHLYETDLNIMQDLKIPAYRFSISWPRVIKNLNGDINEAGLAYYDKIVDGLIARNIIPYITLFHWDLPQYLQEIGGWENPKTIEAFEHYARVIAKHFDKRVTNYFTINEPQIIVGLGYKLGLHAPGLKLSDEKCLLISKNLLLAHGKATLALKATATTNIKVGIASTGKLCFPKNATTKNIAAAQKASFEVDLDNENLYFSHSLFLDPIFLKHFPKEINFPLSEKEIKIISTPIDYLGINIYNGSEVDEDGHYLLKKQGHAQTQLNWPITPLVMYYGLKQLSQRYQIPIVITEDGIACSDKIYLDKQVHDYQRIDFLQRYLQQLLNVIEEGYDIQGYFHWSLTDNFEWHNGYSPRFGLVYIDYANYQRIIKDSGYWYAQVIQKNQIIKMDEYLKQKLTS